MAYGSLKAEVLLLRKQIQDLQERLSLALEREKAGRERVGELERDREVFEGSLRRSREDGGTGALLDTVLGETLRAVGAISGAMFVHEAATDSLRVEAMVLRGEALSLVAPGRGEERLPVGLADTWEVVRREGVPEIEYSCPLWASRSGSRVWQERARHGTIVCLPLPGEGGSFRYLEFWFSGRISPAPERLERFETLARPLATAAAVADLWEGERRAALEEERNRLAREIHDTLAQSLTSILTRLQLAETALPEEPDIVRDSLHHARDLASAGLVEARRSVYALRPRLLEGRGFPEAVRHLCRSLATAAGIADEFRVSGEPRSLPDEMASALLGIVGEAVLNTCKHARAAKVEIDIVYAGERLRLSVRDDGRGFAVAEGFERGGLGLIGARERAERAGARFFLSSQPGRGTRIVVEVEIPR